MDDPDSMLVLAAQGGDKDALAVLIGRHWPLLLALCRRTLGDTIAAEDAAHEAVLQALLSLDQLRRPERFGAWLAGIGLNICRRWLRERSRYGLSWEVVHDGGYTPEMDDPQAQPEAQAERRDLAERVRQAVGALPAGQRSAVNLFYASERTYAETAELLGIEIGAVKTRLHKARTTLRQRLHTLWKEERMAATETKPVEMRVRDVRKETDREKGRYMVVLEEADGPGKLLIWIGHPEGVALAMLIEKEETPRPLTIVFAANLVRNLGGKLQEVRISRLDQQVFYAVATLDGPQGTTSVDARPSDALALALSLGAPIWVEREVLTAAGLAPPEPIPATAEEVQRRYERGASEIVAEAKEQWQR